MTLFIKVAVDYQLDPKIMAVGPEAELMFLRGLAWAKQRLTDGEVPLSALSFLALGLRDDPEEVASRLVIHGIWESTEVGYRVPMRTWSKWQTTRVQVEEISRSRAAAGRKGNKVRWSDQGANAQVSEPESQSATGLFRKGDRKSSPDLQTSDLDQPLLVKPAGSTDPYAESFSELWSLYPRKLNRKEALRAYQARRRSGVSHDDLLTATKHYAATVAGKEPNFVMHGKRFYGPNEVWTDYLTAPSEQSAPREVIER